MNREPHGLSQEGRTHRLCVKGDVIESSGAGSSSASADCIWNIVSRRAISSSCFAAAEDSVVSSCFCSFCCSCSAADNVCYSIVTFCVSASICFSAAAIFSSSGNSEKGSVILFNSSGEDMSRSSPKLMSRYWV